jgi:3-oxoacyl-[acyl-carrier protein] reductase
MDLELKNKVAVVLAGSKGIGRGIAEGLANEGCKIAICARNQEKLVNTANEIRERYNVEVIEKVVDVSDKVLLNSFLQFVIESYGGIDILINNTGGPKVGTTTGLTDEDYMAAYELVLMSKIRACRFVLPYMIKQNWGRIINIESTSIKCALPNMALSNIFRNASVAHSKTLSMEVAGNGVCVHTVMSGPMMTDRVTELGEAAALSKGITFEQWKSEAMASTPMGRFGDPIEFGNLVAFLASNKSNYMTGTCMAFDGGVLTTIT